MKNDLGFSFKPRSTGRQNTDNLFNAIQYGARNNGLYSLEGGMMGFMGLPWLSRGYAGKGSSGPWQWMSPWGEGAGLGSIRGNEGDPGTGGEDPGVTDGTTNPPGGTPNPATGQWAFPQYTQTWAFTPPAPAPYLTPRPFSRSKYGNPFSNKNK